MEETQSFRLNGTTEIKKVPVHHVDGQSVVYWESIEQLFPGVKFVKNGDAVVPLSIKHLPGVVLDVVLGSTTEHACVDPSVGALNMIPAAALTPNQTARGSNTQADPLSGLSSEDKLVEDLRVIAPTIAKPISIMTPSSSPLQLSLTPSGKAALFLQLVKQKVQETKTEQKFISFLAPEIQEKVRGSPNIYQSIAQAINDGQAKISRAELSQELSSHFQELKATIDRNTELQEALNARQEEMVQLQQQVLNNQEEMKQLHIQALGQLAMLQTQVQAVLTQTYELHEYPIPRLFVVLPQNPSGWDTANPFSNNFQLYFLCECGEHTMSIKSKAEIPHVHFAKHEGYEIVRPSEFFQLYGSHILTLLKMLKYGISVAGVVVPTISHLVQADAIDQATTFLRQLKDNIEPGMDHVIEWMDKVSVNEGEAVDEFDKQIEKKEALEGADLRRLITFLKVKDGNKVLGNLYRTVTDKGHVKWVCLDHYRENYQENKAREFQRMLDSVGGSLDENHGLVEVDLRSRVLAEQFYSALGKARSVFELDISLSWACSTSDLEMLEDAIKKSRVSILRLCFSQFPTSVGDKMFYAATPSEVLFRIQEHPSMKVIHILFKDVVKITGFPSKRASHRCKLSFEIHPRSLDDKELQIIAEMLKTNCNLTTLNLGLSQTELKTKFQLSKPFKKRSFVPLPGEYAMSFKTLLIGENGAQVLSEALKTNSILTTLHLDYNEIGSYGAQALAEAVKINSTLTTLYLNFNKIGVSGAQALSEALKTNSVLITLDLSNNILGDNGIQVLSEALKTNSALTTLILNDNLIGDIGTQALSEALMINSTLEILVVRNNKIGARGAQALAVAVKTNSTLGTLDVCSNSMGDNGAQVLSVALKTNSALTTLSLSANLIGDIGAQALSEALMINSTLETLNVGNNDIGARGAQAMVEALITNSALTTLHLFCNSIDDEAQVIHQMSQTTKCEINF